MIRRDFIRGLAPLAALPLLGTRGLPRRARQPGTAPLLDAHTHVNSAAAVDFVEQHAGRRSVGPITGRDLVDRLDEAEIPRAIVLSTAYLMAADVWQRQSDEDEEYERVRRENDHAAEEAGRHPDRLIPFLSLNPKRDYALDEIDRCVERLGMRGLKLHFWNSLVNIREEDDRQRVHAVLRHAAERELPVVLHVFNGALADFGPPDVEILAQDVIQTLPTLRLSIAHLGGAGNFGPRPAAIFAALTDLFSRENGGAPRVFVDMSAVLFARTSGFFRETPAPLRARMGELLDLWGLERVLWGSDNVLDYLALSRDAWPLEGGAWDVVANQDGASFLGSA